MSGPDGGTAGPLPHERCEICSSIPDRVSNSYTGDERRGDPLPPAVGRLVIVGAPHYDDDTSRSNWALHKCPLCGTHYSWDFEYEYLAGGSEDSTVFTRLDPETGARLERECLQRAAAARERMREKAAALAAALVGSPDGKAVSDARVFQLLHVEKWDVPLDLREAVPSLVASLVRAGEAATAALRRDVESLLSAWVGEDRARATEVLARIASSAEECPSREARGLAARCEAVLAGRRTG